MWGNKYDECSFWSTLTVTVSLFLRRVQGGVVPLTGDFHLNTLWYGAPDQGTTVFFLGLPNGDHWHQVGQESCGRPCDHLPDTADENWNAVCWFWVKTDQKCWRSFGCEKLHHFSNFITLNSTNLNLNVRLFKFYWKCSFNHLVKANNI